MTRLAVLSDIHGNLPALQAVLEDASRQAVDGFIQAGDYTGGPQAPECLLLQRSLPGWMIRGNGEVNLRRYEQGDCPPAWKTNHQFSLLRWDHARLSRSELDFLYALPEQEVVQIEGTASIRVVHGSPRSPYEQIFIEDAPVLQRALADTREAVLVCGHTHCPWSIRQDRQLALNPGAVCGPLNGFTGAQYAILSWQVDSWQVEQRALPLRSGSRPPRIRRQRSVGSQRSARACIPAEHRARPGCGAQVPGLCLLPGRASRLQQ